jgi:hypothetical protein
VAAGAVVLQHDPPGPVPEVAARDEVAAGVADLDLAFGHGKAGGHDEPRQPHLGHAPGQWPGRPNLQHRPQRRNAGTPFAPGGVLHREAHLVRRRAPTDERVINRLGEHMGSDSRCDVDERPAGVRHGNAANAHRARRVQRLMHDRQPVAVGSRAPGQDLDATRPDPGQAVERARGEVRCHRVGPGNQAGRQRALLERHWHRGQPDQPACDPP